MKYTFGKGLLGMRTSANQVHAQQLSDRQKISQSLVSNSFLSLARKSGHGHASRQRQNRGEPRAEPGSARRHNRGSD